MKSLIPLVLVCAAFGQTNPPIADSIYPTGTKVPLNTRILVHLTCCGPTPTTVSTGGKPVAGTIDNSVSNWILFTPSPSLLPNTTYTVNVSSAAGRPAVTTTFTTGAGNDTTAPVVTSTQPGDGQDVASSAPAVTIHFSKPMNPASFTSGSVGVTDFATPDASGFITGSLQDALTYVIGPTPYGEFPLQLGKVYRLRFGTTLPQDLASNTLAAPLPDIVFTTYFAAPKDGPALRGSIPAEGETGVPTNGAICLVFNRRISPPDPSAINLSAVGGANVAVKLESASGGNEVIVRPQLLLQANQPYTLRIDRVYDVYAGKTAAPLVLHFQTGSLPEARTFGMTSQPSTHLPDAATLRWTFSLALNPFLLPYVAHIDVSTTGYNPSMIPTRLMPDGVTLEADIPGPGQYVLAGAVFDRALSQPFSTFGFQAIETSALHDATPPSLLQTYPPSGASVPANAAPIAIFDEVLDPAIAAQVTLWEGQSRVAATVSVSGAQVTITPKSPLANDDYRAEIVSPRDLAGNEASTVSWSFHVPAPANADTFQLVNVDPADGTMGVNAYSALTLTFNRPPNPISLTTGFSPGTVTATSGAVTGSWQVNGNQAIFQPDPGFPPQARINWNFDARDLSNNRVSLAGGFWTAAADPPATPFQAVAVSPAPGEWTFSGSSAIVLQFNQPANPASVSAQNIQLIGPGQTQGVQVSYDATGRRAMISTDRLSGTYRLVAGPGVLSQMGVPLQGFSADVQLRQDSLAYGYPSTPAIGPFLRFGGQGSASFPVDAPINVYFTQPMQHDLAEQALRIYIGDKPVAGRMDWTPDSTALRFTPAAPLPYQASGVLAFSSALFGGTGMETIYFSTPAPPSTPSSPAAVWNLVSPFPEVPTDAVIDVAFDTDRPGYILSAVATSGNGSAVIQTPLEVQMISPRRYRFRSAQAWPPRSYLITAKTTQGDLQSPIFGLASYPTPTSHLIFPGPTAAMGPAPVNTQIWIESQTPLNAAAFHASLTLAGAAVPFTTEFTDQGFLALLHPVAMLSGNATYTVALTGLEDMAGRPLPDRTWTFQTAAGPDFTPAQIMSSSPTGVAPASTSLSVTFDKPVFLVRHPTQSYSVASTDFSIRTPSITITGDISYSDDGRTLTYVPNGAWPPATVIGLAIDRFHYYGWTGAAINETRLAGNNLLVPGFTTAPVPALPSPVLDAVNPYRGAPDAPLNVQIQARFAEPVSGGSLSGIHLDANGSPVPVQVTLAADGRTISLAPQGGLLQPGQTYTVTVDGVANANGVPQNTPDVWTFQTANRVALGTSSAKPVLVPGDSVVLRLDLLVPVNAITAGSSTVSMQVRGMWVAAAVQVDAAAQSILVSPIEPVPPGAGCGLSTTGLLDWAGNTITARGQFPACVAPSSNSGSPVVTPLPGDGAVMSWNDSAAVIVDRPFVLRYGDAAVQLTDNGVSIAAAVHHAQYANFFTVHPTGDWIPGDTYQVTVRGITDTGDNEVPPFAWSFQVAPDGSRDSTTLRVLSSTPAPGAVGVPPNSGIAFDFSKPVIPSDTYGSGNTLMAFVNQTQVDLGKTLQPSWQGTHLQLTPGPLPAGATIGASVAFGDLTGRTSNTYLSFSTASPPDLTPPTLESITPPAGSQLLAGAVDFVLRFSKPVVFLNGVSFGTSSSTVSPNAVTYPVAGDGRTVILSFQLPPDSNSALYLLSGIVDLAGNSFSPIAIPYTTDTANHSVALQVVSITPLTGDTVTSLTAPIQIRFNQPVPQNGLATSLTVMNNGVPAAVTLTPDSSGAVWTATPMQPWLPGTAVSVTIASSAYSVTGALLSNAYTSTFQVAASSPNNTESNSLAALVTSTTVIDLRYSAPRSRPPAEPFGIRLGQKRIPARIEQAGDAWFRLIPDDPLDPAKPYVLMAGPGAEFPLHIAKEEPAVDVPGESRGEMDAGGVIRVQIGDHMRRFAFGPRTVELLDGEGSAVAYGASVSEDGRVLLVVPYRRAQTYRLRLNGKTIEVRQAPPR